MPKDSPSNPANGPDCGTAADGSTTTCAPSDEFELVELIEVVEQDEEKFVKGAADETTDTKVVRKSVGRTDKHDGVYRQYINIDPDLEGQPKRHPEYGKVIRFRARVKQKDGKTDKLAGVKVVFKVERVDGPQRKDPGGKEPVVWAAADLTNAQKEGFGGPGGATDTSKTTDANGWTDKVELYLSEFGGDQFKVSCALDASVKGAAGASPKTTKANFAVWRRLWYQMTYADGFAAKRPSDAETAFAEVFAELVKGNEKKFTKADFPADLQDRTFLPEFQLKSGGGATIVANVGVGNGSEFVSNAKLKLDADAAQPVKDSVIVCEYQCDPADDSQVQIFKLTTPSATKAMTGGGSIVCKPALSPGAKLVVRGEWATTKKPWNKGGDITDADITIEAGRADTTVVKVTLPVGAPVPSKKVPVWVKLKVRTAEDFLGWAAAGGVVVVYQPGAPVNDQCGEKDYNCTVAHELGHKLNQSAKPGKQPASLKNHPLQYVGHGGQGSHCRHAAKVAKGKVDWQKATQKKPSPQKGDCIMFHKFSAKCAHTFCVVCKSYLQLEPMKSL